MTKKQAASDFGISFTRDGFLITGEVSLFAPPDSGAFVRVTDKRLLAALKAAFAAGDKQWRAKSTKAKKPSR